MIQGEVQSYLNNWQALLESENPCGEDLELEEDFESLQEEVGRDTSIHAERPTDWAIVLEMADTLLARSKDIWIFSYGIIALYQTKGLKSCAEGISSLAALLARSWDAAYPLPRRLQRRLAPLRWLRARLGQYAEHTGFIGEPPDSLRGCKLALETLQSLLDEKIPDNDLAFDKVLSCIQGLAEAPPPPETAVVEETAGPEKSKPAEKPAPPPPPKAQLTNDILGSIEKDGRIPAGALPQVIRTCNDISRQLGDHLLSLSITDERGYLLHRAACWSTLLQLPPVDEQKRTQLLCPAEPDRLAAYTAAIEEKRFSEVLPQIEKTASKSPFWLDGHYMVTRCLEGLGATAAGGCLKHTLAQLLNRFPDLVEYKFKDGKPFASAQTVTWLDVIVQSTFAGPHTGYSPGVTGSSYDKGGDELRLQQAIEIQAEKGFQAGLDHLGNVPPGRCRAALRHALLKARYCLAAGRKNAGRHMLQNIYSDLEKWDLFDWEPKISAAVISLLISALPKSQEADREELLAMLHKYNLPEALKLMPEAS